MTGPLPDVLLARRVGWGEVMAADALVDPDGHGIAASPDPWEGLDLTPQRPGPDASEAEKQHARQAERQQTEAAINAWLDHLVTTPRPLEEWMAWFWHGHFVSGLDKVRMPLLMVQQLRLFRSLALAPFPQLVRAVTTDPAMLLYLDGATSTGTQPNENYGRELLELFTLGVGNYSEDDVKAGARALTGWTIDRTSGRSRFAPRRHDDTPQHYLGVEAHDVDTVVAAVTRQASCAPFVAGKLARAILGPVDDRVVAPLASEFASSGLDTRALVRAIVDLAHQGQAQPMTVAPVPWLVAAQRITGGTLRPAIRIAGLKAAGQVPMLPPNVAGWPSGPAWFGASTMVARTQLSSAIAASAPAMNAARHAAAAFDLDELADVLLRPEGFAPATRTALARVKDDPHRVLAVALASPDLAVA